MATPHIVIDTNVVVTAQRSQRGASSKLLSLVGTGLFTCHLSVPLALEYEEVLVRQHATLGLTTEDVTDVVDALCALAVPHLIYFLWRPYLRDATDDHVLELAVVAHCAAIITYNLSDFHGVERFGIETLTPKHFLHQIGVLR